MTKYNTPYYLKKINTSLLLLLFAFPIFPLRISAFIMVLFGISCFVNYFLVEKVKLKFDFLLILSLLFPLLYLLSYFIYSKSFDSWFEFEKRIALIVIPVLYSFTRIEITKSKLLLAYNISVNVLSLLVLIYLLFWGINEVHLIGGKSYAIRASIADLTSIHPTYFSFFVGFSFFIILNKLLQGNYKSTGLVLNILSLCILTIMLILLASKILFIASLVIIPIIVIKSDLKKIHRLGIIGIFALFISLSIIFIPNLNQRFSELEITSFSIPQNSEINSTNQRLGIYHCSFELLKKNFVLGLGTAKLQQKLNECYKSIHISELEKRDYNTHNEYLNIWLGMGFIGLLLFLSILFLSFRKSMSNIEHFIFLVLFCFLCLTENILSRQHGVFFFVIVNYFFVFANSKQIDKSE